MLRSRGKLEHSTLIGRHQSVMYFTKRSKNEKRQSYKKKKQVTFKQSKPMF